MTDAQRGPAPLKGWRRALLAGVAALALLAGEPEAAGAQAYLPSWWLAVEGRLFTQAGARQPWSTQTSAFVFDPTTAFIRADSGWGGRFAVGFRIAPPWSVAVSYTGLRSHKRRGDATSVYYGLLYPVVGAYRTGGAPYYPTTATVTVRNALDVIDFEIGYDVGLGAGGKLRIFAGPRLALWTHAVDTQFNYRFIFFSQTLTESLRARFIGAGPRIGADGKWTLGEAGGGTVFVRGVFAASALYGVARTVVETEMNAQFFGTSRFVFERERTHWVFSTEGALSLGFAIGATRFGTFSLEAGYRVEAWWRLLDTRGAPFAAGCACVALKQVNGSSGGNVAQHGPFLRATIKF